MKICLAISTRNGIKNYYDAKSDTWRVLGGEDLFKILSTISELKSFKCTWNEKIRSFTVAMNIAPMSITTLEDEFKKKFRLKYKEEATVSCDSLDLSTGEIDKFKTVLLMEKIEGK